MRSSVALAAVLSFTGVMSIAADEKTDQKFVISAQKHVLRNAQSVAFSRDGLLLAAGIGGPSSNRFPLQPVDGRAVVWEAKTGKKILDVGEFGDIVRIDFTHDAKSLIYGRVFTPGDSIDFDAAVHVDVASGKILGRCTWTSEDIYAVSPVASRIAILRDLAPGLCTVYDVDFPNKNDQGGKLSLDQSGNARLLAFSPDGSVLAAVHHMLEPIVDKAGVVNPNAKAVRLKGLATFDAKTLAPRKTIINDELQLCSALDIAPEGSLIATGHAAGVVRIWDGATLAKLRELDLKVAAALCPRFSPDGKSLALLTQPNSPSRKPENAACELVLYETKTFQPVRRFVFEDGAFITFHAGRPAASLNPRRLAFSPDGKLLAVGCNGVVLINVESGEVIRQFDVK